MKLLNRQTKELLKKLSPTTAKVFVMSGSGKDAAWVNAIVKIQRPYMCQCNDLHPEVLCTYCRIERSTLSELIWESVRTSGIQYAMFQHSPESNLEPKVDIKIHFNDR